ncbi:MAG: carboxypeptidase regulatory-like domain-containing protein [Thermoanaerobaculia bacterium]|nr:carboxypeptidase regulatory-like domain-containing protein [Thermoanaerobaculia bacterium]
MRVLFLAAVTSLVMCLPNDAAAQSWAGQGRLSGVVLDEHEEPLEGAEVRVSLGDHGGPPAVSTNRKGRWSMLGLASGRWSLVVSADGYLQSDGVVDVAPGPSGRLRVVLRPLSEATGIFAEQAQSVLGWIQRGNSLLEQGKPLEARAEYEKSLPHLGESQKAEVLQAVARTHALERNLDGASSALRKALVYAPDDDTTRQLFTSLLAGFGRGDEAAEWLVRLDTEGAEALREEMGLVPGTTIQAPTDRALPVDLPVLDAEAHRTGTYRLRIDGPSPLGSLDAFLERTGKERSQIEAVNPGAGPIDLAEESFEVFVPEGYEPGASGWGLMVWVSPGNYGGLQRPDNLATLADKRMIWIGANWAGNYRKVWDRVRLALHAAHAMAKLYDLDSSRIYAAGYSGGGRMATWLSMLYPEVFHGGFFVKGVDYYENVAMPDKPGAHWPAAFGEPPRSTWPQVKERNRYVFFTGENDFNRLQTKTFARRYEDDGFRHVHYLEEPGANHYTAFGGEILSQVIDMLDDR